MTETASQWDPTPLQAAPPPMLAGSGATLASPWRRFGAQLLNALLTIVTLYIGWIIWTIVLWSKGQNPGQRILGLRVVDERTGLPPGRGRMFIRNFLCLGVLMNILTSFVIPIVLYFMPFWDAKNQSLWDKMASTLVVNDPNRTLEPSA